MSLAAIATMFTDRRVSAKQLAWIVRAHASAYLGHTREQAVVHVRYSDVSDSLWLGDRAVGSAVTPAFIVHGYVSSSPVAAIDTERFKVDTRSLLCALIEAKYPDAPFISGDERSQVLVLKLD